jgi:hypothetical protein
LKLHEIRRSELSGIQPPAPNDQNLALQACGPTRCRACSLLWRLAIRRIIIQQRNTS